MKAMPGDIEDSIKIIQGVVAQPPPHVTRGRSWGGPRGDQGECAQAGSGSIFSPCGTYEQGSRHFWRFYRLFYKSGVSYLARLVALRCTLAAILAGRRGRTVLSLPVRQREGRFDPGGGYGEPGGGPPGAGRGQRPVGGKIAKVGKAARSHALGLPRPMNRICESAKALMAQ